MLNDSTRVEVYHLYHRMIDAGILDHLHVFLAVEEQRIILLTHEVALHAPMVTINRFHLAAIDFLQRKHDTLHLQFAAGSKVIEEIVKQFIGSLRHREVCQRVVNRLINGCGISGTHGSISGDFFLDGVCLVATTSNQQ